MAAGRSRARSRVACTFGMGVVALVGVAMIPARAAAQQKQTTPPKAGTVMPGISDDQICSMLKGALKGKKGGGNSAANRRAYQQIDVATPERALQGHTPTSRSTMRSTAQGSAATPELALLGQAPAASATPKNAASQGGGMQISVSTGPGQPARQVTCK